MRRLLNEHALSAHELKGSGRDGRITVQDVERHLDQKRRARCGGRRRHRGDADATAKMRRPAG